MGRRIAESDSGVGLVSGREVYQGISRRLARRHWCYLFSSRRVLSACEWATQPARSPGNAQETAATIALFSLVAAAYSESVRFAIR
jgi:hypothetical protein